MNEPVWLLNEVVSSVHQMLLAEHGGSPGLRDADLLAASLSRPKQKYHYEPDSTLHKLAASYSFGLAKNHPFIDGNKRIAFMAGALFLELNGYTLIANEPEAAIKFEALAAGKVSENELSEWFEGNSERT